MATKNLYFDLYGRDKSASKTIRGIGNEADRVGPAFKRMGAFAVAGLAIAGAAFVDFAAEGVKSLKRIEVINAQTASAIKSTGGAANVTADHVEGLAGKIEKLTATEGESIQEGANLLLTFKNIRNEAGEGNDVFDQSVSVLTDMARAMGKEPQDAAIQLGKALNDPIAGISALSRVGVQFTDDQKNLIQSLVDSGDMMGAQQVILGELNSQFGGSGAAFADTYAGKIDLIAHKFGEAQEQVASNLMPTLEGMADWIETDGIPALEGLMAALELDGGKGDGPLAPNQDLFKKGLDTREGPARLLGQIMDLFTDPGKVFDDIADGGGLVGQWLPNSSEWEQYWRDNTTITVDGVGNVRGGMGGGLSGMGTDLDVFRAATGEKFGGTWTDADGRTRSGLGVVGASTGTGILGVLAQVLGLSAVGPQVGTAWSGANSQTVTGWGGIQGSTAAGVGNVGSEVDRIPGVVQSPFSNAGNWLRGAGVSIVDGLIGGITGMIGSAARAAANLAAATIEAAKDVLGIQSPSTVFRDIGMDLGAGFDEGIERAMASSERTVEALVSVPANTTPQASRERSTDERRPMRPEVIQLVVDGRILAQVLRDNERGLK